MNSNKNNFDINLNAGTTLAGATVANNKQDEYVNLNCYKIVDGVPLWLFRVSTVPLNRNATEKFLQKQFVEAYKEKGIEATANSLADIATALATVPTERITLTFCKSLFIVDTTILISPLRIRY